MTALIGAGEQPADEEGGSFSNRGPTVLLDSGSKILVCHRRLFPEDQPRFFVGSVTGYEPGLVKVNGVTWTRDVARGFHRKADFRTKLISLHSGAVIVYELPAEVEIEGLRLEQPSGHEILLHDGGKFRMDLSERVV